MGEQQVIIALLLVNVLMWVMDVRALPSMVWGMLTRFVLCFSASSRVGLVYSAGEV